MQLQNCLEGGWALVPCFHFLVGILKLTRPIMNLGPSEKSSQLQPGLLDQEASKVAETLCFPQVRPLLRSHCKCEEVCRLALMRRYHLLPHIYTLFYMAHTRGTPVATPTFFADLKDQELRKLENSFMLGSLLVHARFILFFHLHGVYYIGKG
ncbi:unnamed protein product [Cuscuta campestris]|uniref:Uncharacterized protein n=1 Tax=Cuscuta campestris TaxID=132261 RepID=A0A484K8A5_9ASTE|nr:unnamed protein product [Cuscuta campestris]